MKITVEWEIEAPASIERAIKEARSVFLAGPWDAPSNKETLRLSLYGPEDNSAAVVAVGGQVRITVSDDS